VPKAVQEAASSVLRVGGRTRDQAKVMTKSGLGGGLGMVPRSAGGEMVHETDPVGPNSRLTGGCP
jgi:hypothetical protein